MKILFIISLFVSTSVFAMTPEIKVDGHKIDDPKSYKLKVDEEVTLKCKTEENGFISAKIDYASSESETTVLKGEAQISRTISKEDGEFGGFLSFECMTWDKDKIIDIKSVTIKTETKEKIRTGSKVKSMSVGIETGTTAPATKKSTPTRSNQ
jgi:ribosomal protein S4